MQTYKKIASDQNPKIKLVTQLLTQPRKRRKSKLFLAEGVRLVEQGIQQGFKPQFILFCEGLSQRGLQLIETQANTTQVFMVDSALFNKLTDTENSQGILAVFDEMDLVLPDQPNFLLIADNIRDPGNLGTILRSAEAAGTQAVLLSPGCADAFNPKVVRAGMGAHFTLPIMSLSWSEIDAFCKNMTIFSAETTGEIVYWQADFCQPCALLIGSEAFGLSSQAQKLQQQPVSIPMAGRGESLNASVAAGILLFEVLRQRHHKG